MVVEALICLRFSAIAKNGAADNSSKSAAKLFIFEPSLCRKRDILRSMERGFAVSLPDRWQALKAGACRATAARLRP